MSTTAIPNLASFRTFFRDEFEQHAAEIERTDRIPEELLRRTAEIGAYRLTAPEELGGFALGAATYLDYLEAAAMGPGAGRMLVHVNNGLWRPLCSSARREQSRASSQDRPLARSASRSRSPRNKAGRHQPSDLRSLRATRSGSDWKITGEKHLITFGDRADHFMLVVPRRASRAGLADRLPGAARHAGIGDRRHAADDGHARHRSRLAALRGHGRSATSCGSARSGRGSRSGSSSSSTAGCRCPLAWSASGSARSTSPRHSPGSADVRPPDRRSPGDTGPPRRHAGRARCRAGAGPLGRGA